LAVLAILCALVFSITNPAYSQTPYYQGKTITLLHGRAPGGSGDYRVRAVLPFLQKYIPGNPTFVHEYMDGGGGRKAANHIFSMTRTDGLVIGNVGGGVVANAVLRKRRAVRSQRCPIALAPPCCLRAAKRQAEQRLRQASGVFWQSVEANHYIAHLRLAAQSEGPQRCHRLFDTGA
jgi:hypothetical protein